MKTKIEAFIKKHDMIIQNDNIIAGVSGGADSVCLLFMLLNLREQIPFELTVVHVNHGLRGELAKRDELFVKELCEIHQIPCVVYYENVESIAELRKQSLEEAGRMVRREALERTMKECGGNKIALAHHQNDNAETMLMNLARGAGLTGISGIRPVHGAYIRPLLCVSRAEIEQWLQEQQIPYCVDETNEEEVYTRNSIRHQVIPVLEQQANTGTIRHMNEAMEQLSELREYMDSQVDRALKHFAKIQEEGSRIKILIDGPLFQSTSPIIQKLAIKKCLTMVTGHDKDFTKYHVESVCELFTKQSGRRIDLPQRIEAIRGYEGVLIKRKQSPQEQIDQKSQESLSYKITIPGTTSIYERHLKIICDIQEIAAVYGQSIPQFTYTKWFDYDIIKNGLTFRTRRPGDYIVIDKSGSKQKLKAYFINEKIPAEIRDRVPLLADGDQVVWILGYRMNSAYQISDKTMNVLQIKVTEVNADGRDN